MRVNVVSSFPRSGNTWMRFMLATAITGERPSSATLDALIPDAHRALAPISEWIQAPGLFVKSHFEPVPLANFLRGMIAGPAAGLGVDRVRTLHIVRNPFDCALSVKRFYETPDEQFDLFLRHFLTAERSFPDAFGFLVE